MGAKERELRVVNRKTREVVRRIPIQAGKSRNQIEKTILGLLRNMSDEYIVDDNDAYGEDT